MPTAPRAVAAVFFATPADLRGWFDRHAATESTLIAGFYKRGSGLPSITWPESVDEALCVGWIDGVRSKLDDDAYQIRFTPRKPTSTWSAINIARVAVLQAEGRMKPAGMAAFARRLEARSKIYAYEQHQPAMLDAPALAKFKRHRRAWKFFEAQPPGYRHVVIWRIVSAKRDDTRQRRLDELIEASDKGERL